MIFRRNQKARGRPRHTRGEMNKTETAYEFELRKLCIAGEIVDYGFERIKFKLADNTYFEIDFYVVKNDLSLEFHEVKGAWKQKDGTYKPHWEDDARVKIKVAAEQFPFFQFVGIAKTPTSWMREEF
jgi:hypothetical protein